MLFALLAGTAAIGVAVVSATPSYHGARGSRPRWMTSLRVGANVGVYR